MTRVLVAVDDSESSVHAAETAHRLFGDTAEYLAVNVTNIVDLASIPWYGAGWGSPYAAPYGAVWSYRSDVTLDPEGIADGEKTAEAQAREVADESGLRRRRGRSARRVIRPTPCCGPPRSTTSTSSSSAPHDRGWFDRLVRPSVSKEIIRESKVPVLVVH